MMVCFETHRTVSLSDVEDIEQLEKTCTQAASDSNDCPAVNTESVNIKPVMKEQFLEGIKYLEHMVDVSSDLSKISENIGRQYLVSVEYVNNMYTTLQNNLRKIRDDTVISLKEQHTEKQKVVFNQKVYVDTLITELSTRLSNIKSVVDCDLDEVASGFNLAPNELLNLPVVNSNPSESKSRVNPDLSSLTTSDPDCLPRIKKANSMLLYKTFGLKGNGSGQFNSPHGVCLGFDEDIIVADSSNHRIQIFDKTGCFKKEFGISGRHEGCLWHPRKVACLPFQRRFVVCDRGYERSRMQIFSEDGKFVKKIYIQFVDIVAGMAVTDKEEIVVVDSVTPTVFIIGPNDFLRSIDCTGFMEEPSDIAVVGKEFYICDFKGHKVVVVSEDGILLRQFGTKRTISFPNGIAVSTAGDVLVGDSHGNFFHIAIFSKNGNFITDFRCPYVKVSRCCCLKITSEGRLITVDKNYHQVIILDTLYLTNDTQ
ncbi:NHL domain containing protein [Asbolus verrucosus]|uniref:NHL domain containing protein n=1 Tax=Asbolus verrucosus TaxID=1661398 RepID=A0A482VGT1_ASBVE|nr:NHL domain containing protein [Asbolus verrucosus]